MEFKIKIPKENKPKKPKRVIDVDTSIRVAKDIHNRTSDAIAKALNPKS